MRVPFLDLKRQYEQLKPEIEDVIGRVVRSGMYIGGEEVRGIEEEIARYSSVRYGVALSSGTDALLASLMAVGIGEGDEVITTPFTFIATAEVISLLRAKPVFVDIEEDTFNMDPDLLEESITGKTRCIIPVHLFGYMADMTRINEIADRHNLVVIEDSAQAIGASRNGFKACSLGDMGCLSFFPSKNLGAFGDGGMVLTNDEGISKKVRIIKDHGSEKKYHHSLIGFNGRLDAIQAAILRIKLKYLDSWDEKRRENALYYNEALQGYVSVPVPKDGYHHVYNQYSITTDRRDELVKYLEARGVSTAIYYPIPLHTQEVFHCLGYLEGDFPVAERVCKRIVSLPVFPELTLEEREYVVGTVISFFES